jgi:hypothetical protein
MKRMITFIMLIGMANHIHAQPFPTLTNYVVNGVVLREGLNYQDVLRRFGKPTRSEQVRNECAETTYRYYYYPNMTFVDRGAGIVVDEIFFNDPKNKIQLSSLTIDGNTTAASIKKLDKIDVRHTKDITTYRLENQYDPSAWIFEYKETHLFRASFFSDDC